MLSSPTETTVNDPLISVVLTAYNASNYLSIALNTLLLQTFPHWECILVDDGSKDNTLAIAQSYAARDKRFQVITQPNGGVAGSRNTGGGLVSPFAKYVCWLDADDCLLPDALEKLYTDIEQHPESIGVFGYKSFIDADGNPTSGHGMWDNAQHRSKIRDGKLEFASKHDPARLEDLFCNAINPMGSMLIRRDIAIRCLPMDTSFSVCSDWEYELRLARYGSFHCLPELVLEYRRHEGNNTNDRLRVHYAAKRVQYVAYTQYASDPGRRAKIIEAYRAIQRSRMGDRKRQMIASLKDRDLLAAANFVARYIGLMLRFVRGVPAKP